MSKKLNQVGLEPTTFGFPCLRSYQLSYWSDNGPEASETYITITKIEFIQCYTVYARVQFMLYVYIYIYIYIVYIFGRRKNTCAKYINYISLYPLSTIVK